ncbi:DUF819 family protein [Algoriphagus namhaensis]
MNLTQDPMYVGGMLCVFAFAAVWLGKFSWGKRVGAPILVILITALAANVGLVPTATSGHPVYLGVFSYVAPIGIFITLLDVDLKSIKDAGLPILSMFLLGALGTVIGVCLAWILVRPDQFIGEDGHVIAGMFTGTYIGGSINFNAVALHYGLNEKADLFAASTVVDNLVGTPWIIAALILPKYLQTIFPRKKKIREDEALSPAAVAERITLKGISAIFGMAFLSLAVSKWMAWQIPEIPEIISLTTLALIFAQFSRVKQIKGTHTIGFFLILLFLAAIGSLCDLTTLSGLGELALPMIAFVSLIVLIHGLVIFGVGAMFKMDWDVISVASQANVGGNTTALAAAESLNRPDLLIPGILVGSLGNALGTYLGFVVAGFLG